MSILTNPSGYFSSAASAAQPAELTVNTSYKNLPMDIDTIIYQFVRTDLPGFTRLSLANRSCLNRSIEIYPWHQYQAHFYGTALKQLNEYAKAYGKNDRYMSILEIMMGIDAERACLFLKEMIYQLKGKLEESSNWVLARDEVQRDVQFQNVSYASERLNQIASFLERYMVKFPGPTSPLFKEFAQLKVENLFKLLESDFRSAYILYRALKTYYLATNKQDELAKFTAQHEWRFQSYESFLDKDFDQQLEERLKDPIPTERCLSLLKARIKNKTSGLEIELCRKVFSKLSSQAPDELSKMCKFHGLQPQLTDWYIYSGKFDLALEIFNDFIQKMRKEEHSIILTEYTLRKYLTMITGMQKSRLHDLLSKVFLEVAKIENEIFQLIDETQNSVDEGLISCFEMLVKIRCLSHFIQKIIEMKRHDLLIPHFNEWNDLLSKPRKPTSDSFIIQQLLIVAKAYASIDEVQSKEQSKELLEKAEEILDRHSGPDYKSNYAIYYDLRYATAEIWMLVDPKHIPKLYPEEQYSFSSIKDLLELTQLEKHSLSISNHISEAHMR